MKMQRRSVPDAVRCRLNVVDDAMHMRMRLIAAADDHAYVRMRGINGGECAVGRPQHFGAVEARGFIGMPGQAKGVHRLG